MGGSTAGRGHLGSSRAGGALEARSGSSRPGGVPPEVRGSARVLEPYVPSRMQSTLGARRRSGRSSTICATSTGSWLLSVLETGNPVLMAMPGGGCARAIDAFAHELHAGSPEDIRRAFNSRIRLYGNTPPGEQSRVRNRLVYRLSNQVETASSPGPQATASDPPSYGDQAATAVSQLNSTRPSQEEYSSSLFQVRSPAPARQLLSPGRKERTPATVDASRFFSVLSLHRVSVGGGRPE